MTSKAPIHIDPQFLAQGNNENSTVQDLGPAVESPSSFPFENSPDLAIGVPRAREYPPVASTSSHPSQLPGVGVAFIITQAEQSVADGVHTFTTNLDQAVHPSVDNIQRNKAQGKSSAFPRRPKLSPKGASPPDPSAAAFLEQRLGPEKWQHFSARLYEKRLNRNTETSGEGETGPTRTGASAVEFLIKVEIVKEVLRNYVPHPYNPLKSLTHPFPQAPSGEVTLTRTSVLSLCGWSNTQFSYWGRRAEALAILAPHDPRLRAVAQALEHRLRGGEPPGISYSNNKPPIEDTITGKGLDSIIDEVKKRSGVSQFLRGKHSSLDPFSLPRLDPIEHPSTPGGSATVSDHSHYPETQNDPIYLTPVEPLDYHTPHQIPEPSFIGGGHFPNPQFSSMPDNAYNDASEDTEIPDVAGPVYGGESSILQRYPNFPLSSYNTQSDQVFPNQFAQSMPLSHRPFIPYSSSGPSSSSSLAHAIIPSRNYDLPSYPLPSTPTQYNHLSLPHSQIMDHNNFSLTSTTEGQSQSDFRMSMEHFGLSDARSEGVNTALPETIRPPSFVPSYSFGNSMSAESGGSSLIENTSLSRKRKGGKSDDGGVVDNTGGEVGGSRKMARTNRRSN